MTATVRMDTKNQTVTVYCPLGHVVEFHEVERGEWGSALLCETSNRHAGDRFDRLADTCNGFGH